MNNYPLKTLLNLRKQHKKQAEQDFSKKLAQENQIQRKINLLTSKLSNKQATRNKLSQDIFEKNKNQKYQFHNINTIQLRAQKLLTEINFVKKQITQQEQVLKQTITEKNYTLQLLNQAHQKLKLLEKHYTIWDTKQKKSRELRLEYINDDLTCSQFWQKNKNNYENK